MPSCHQACRRWCHTPRRRWRWLPTCRGCRRHRLRTAWQMLRQGTLAAPACMGSKLFRQQTPISPTIAGQPMPSGHQAAAETHSLRACVRNCGLCRRPSSLCTIQGMLTAPGACPDAYSSGVLHRKGTRVGAKGQSMGRSADALAAVAGRPPDCSLQPAAASLPA